MMKMITGMGLRGVAFMLALAPVGACAQPVGQATRSTDGGARAIGVTFADFVKRHEKRLMASDGDGNDKVSKAEFLAAARDGRRDPAVRFAKLDQNGDGMLDKAEIDAMLDRRFRELDANGDGIVTAGERAAARGKAGMPTGDGSNS